MKGTEHFKETIKRYLDGRAQADELFTVSHPFGRSRKASRRGEKAEVSHKNKKITKWLNVQKSRLKKF